MLFEGPPRPTSVPRKRVRYGQEVWSSGKSPVGALFASSMSPEHTQTVSDQAPPKGGDRLRPRAGSRGSADRARAPRSAVSQSQISQPWEGSEDRYTDAVGLLVPRQDAF